MKWFHVAAGVLSLLSGAMALVATKGGDWHRRGGTVFFWAMLAMAGSGALIAMFLAPNPVNVMAGTITCYLVLTGRLAVTRRVEDVRGWLTVLMFVALGCSVAAWVMVGVALNSPGGKIGSLPWPPLAMFGVVGAVAGALDGRLLRAGTLRGAHRIARHLWRMGFAMWLATTSFFLGQPRVFPDVLRYNVGLRAIPVLVVAIFIAWSLWRVLRRRLRGVATEGSRA